MVTQKSKPLILLGAGGHAKVLLSLLNVLHYDIIGVCDPELIKSGVVNWRGVPVLGDDSVIEKYSPSDIGMVNGIGQRVGDSTRSKIFQCFKDRGYDFPVLVHPTAYVDNDVLLAEGVQVMAGVIIQPGVSVGENSIINTKASVDHDCTISSDVHIAPGAILCGGVSVGIGAFVGAGAVIAQGVSIGNEAVIGAGASLVRNLEPRQRVLPARLVHGLIET